MFRCFTGRAYLQHVAERVEPGSYIKFCYLKEIDCKGFTAGPESGVYCEAPLARVNVAEGMARQRGTLAHHSIRAGVVDDGILNRIEAAFRADDS